MTLLISFPWFLELTCVATHPELTLLPYFLGQMKYDTFLAMLQETNFSAVQIWKPFESALPNYSKVELPETLKEVPSILMNHLIDQISGIRQFKDMETEKLPLWSIILISIGAVILAVALLFLCRRHLSKLKIRRGGGKEKMMKTTDMEEKDVTEQQQQQQLSLALRREVDVSDRGSSKTPPVKKDSQKLEATPVSSLICVLDGDDRETSL